MSIFSLTGGEYILNEPKANTYEIEKSTLVDEHQAPGYWQEEAISFGLSQDALMYALHGYNQLKHGGMISDTARLVIADFSKTSVEERFYVINMENGFLEYKSLVAHGKNTGALLAENFSNEISSYKSSLGFYLTAETYQGKHGLSIRL
ncbi:MAG: murein L,D-transpeptidase catalytic domain-containing protein, partial [Cyclobacteriaceae bacterium]